MTCRSNGGKNWGAIAGEIRQSVPALDAARQFGLNVNEHGFARCPFHGDKTPSLKVYGGSRGYYCFACKASGSVIDLVSKLCGTGPRDTMRLIDSAFGLGLVDGDTDQLRKKREALKAKKDAQNRIVKQTEAKHDETLRREKEAKSAANKAVRAVRITYDEEGMPVLIGDADAMYAAIADMAHAVQCAEETQAQLFEQYAQARRDKA